MPRLNARPHGQVRYSQVVTTFGPGSLLDLPKQSVIVGGLDHWAGVGDEVHEPRLAEKLKRLLSLPALKLFSPPPDNEDPTAPRTGITAWLFPEWFITQDVERSERGDVTRSRRCHGSSPPWPIEPSRTRISLRRCSRRHRPMRCPPASRR